MPDSSFSASWTVLTVDHSLQIVVRFCLYPINYFLFPFFKSIYHLSIFLASKAVPDIILDWGLGPGESAVLALAYENPGMAALVDDISARKCAAFLQIPVRGTYGIGVAARRLANFAVTA